MTGITYMPKLCLWSVEWWENDKQRIKHFRAQQGFLKAKLLAEEFRQQLVATGRVDNRRTRRQLQEHNTAKQEAQKIMKKKFNVKDARRKGNSGTRLGPARRVREDYKRRGLMP
jgi:hypothetical protein